MRVRSPSVPWTALVAHLNIEDFKHLLETETDEKKRALIAGLLADEKPSRLLCRRNRAGRGSRFVGPFLPVRWVDFDALSGP